MHPTMTQMLVQDRHAALHAEADAARLASVARSRSLADDAAPVRRDHARFGAIRRVVHRLVPA